MNSESKLKNYIICCHVDKELTQPAPESIFDINIQAGAALTDKRICAINDLDDCDDNISDRNSRYSEATAMYWIGKHIDSQYIGIMHYRRRLALTDEQYTGFIAKGVDIITTELYDLGKSIEDDYRETLYSCDWDLFMEILKSRDSGNYSFYRDLFGKSIMHICNVSVYKNELYNELCNWAFPILDDFYRLSPEKTDVYQHRDVGFIMERLSHLFVSKKKRDGFKIETAPLVDLQSDEWRPEKECTTNEPSEIFDVCNRLYQNNQIIKCNNVLAVALQKGADRDERIKLLSELLITSIKERMEIPVSMHEYLPIEFRSNLYILIDVWRNFKTIVKIHYDLNNIHTLDKLTEYMELTHFSKVALREARLYSLNSHK